MSVPKICSNALWPFFADNLLTTDCGIHHHGATIDADEELMYGHWGHQVVFPAQCNHWDVLRQYLLVGHALATESTDLPWAVSSSVCMILRKE